jgi:hypothetical protein
MSRFRTTMTPTAHNVRLRLCDKICTQGAVYARTVPTVSL